MKETHKLVILIFCCLLVNSYLMAESVDPQVDLLKQILLSKEEQVTSFCADYTLSQEGFGQNINLTWHEDQKHSLKYKEDVYKWTRERLDDSGWIKKTYSNYGGIFVSLQTGDYAPNDQGAAGIVGRKKSSVPKGAYLDPRMVTFGYMDKKTLKDNFENSEFFAWKSKDGYDVLSCVNKTDIKRNDFYLDQNLELIKIKYGNSPTENFINENKEVFAGLDRKDIFDVMWEIELSEFVTVDGIDVPMKAVRRKKTLSKLSSDKKMNREEMTRFGMQEKNKEVYVVQTMIIDKDSIQVNPKLGEKELKIVFPVGTTVIDKNLEIDFVVGESSEDYILGALANAKNELAAPEMALPKPSNNSETSSDNIQNINKSANAVSDRDDFKTSDLTKVKKVSHLKWTLLCVSAIFILITVWLLSRKKG